MTPPPHLTPRAVGSPPTTTSTTTTGSTPPFTATAAASTFSLVTPSYSSSLTAAASSSSPYSLSSPRSMKNTSSSGSSASSSSKCRLRLPMRSLLVSLVLAALPSIFLQFFWLDFKHNQQPSQQEPGKPSFFSSSSSTSDSSTNTENEEVMIEVVGIVITITSCSHSSFPENSTTSSTSTAATSGNRFLDGAAVLQYSLFLQSAAAAAAKSSAFDNNNTQYTRSRYRYKFYAVYHPNAASCVQPLSTLGYTLLERETPVNISEIRNPVLQKKMAESGCCGEKELIKFEAFRLTQHAAVLIMDVDSLVLQPLDAILDLILYQKQPAEDYHLMKHPERPQYQQQQQENWIAQNSIWLLYTSDYEMVRPSQTPKPTQGGFTVIRPNLTIYNEIMDIVREGDFDPYNGWGNQTDIFWGVTTFQGLMPYYFHILHPGHAVELNWCRYNNMNVAPFDMDQTDYCMATGHKMDMYPCEDCRKRRLEDGEVYTFHFTKCFKPWFCVEHKYQRPQSQLCRSMHRAWFQLRSDMERSWGRSGHGEAAASSDTSAAIALSPNVSAGAVMDPKFHGYCHQYGEFGYEPIRQPYGVVA